MARQRCAARLPYRFPQLTADYDAVPDVDVLVQGIRRGLAELGGQPSGTVLHSSSRAHDDEGAAVKNDELAG